MGSEERDMSWWLRIRVEPKKEKPLQCPSRSIQSLGESILIVCPSPLANTPYKDTGRARSYEGMDVVGVP